jgi:putative SOS response-associated peptidase YedK
MCGRFVSASPPDEIARYFDAVTDDRDALEPNYNVAPTDDVYAVLVEDGARRLDVLHWGLVPGFASDPKIGARLINARVETLATNNSFKRSLRHRRCLVPADGFYEWKAVGPKQKQAMYAHPGGGGLFAFAGLWAVWRDRANPGQELHSCTIVTGPPNETMAPIHDRMPVILPPGAWDTWLDPDIDDVDRLRGLLVPAPASTMDVYPVSGDVNNVRNQGPHLIERVESIEHETLL